jgi:hypothetical protein
MSDTTKMSIAQIWQEFLATQIPYDKHGFEIQGGNAVLSPNGLFATTHKQLYLTSVKFGVLMETILTKHDFKKDLGEDSIYGPDFEPCDTADRNIARTYYALSNPKDKFFHGYICIDKMDSDSILYWASLFAKYNHLV